MTPPIVQDMWRVTSGRPRRYIPIVGQPGTTAVVTVPGAEEGWNSTATGGAIFDNRIAAANAVGLAVISAKRTAVHIQAPVLVCVSAKETLMDVKHVYDVARRIPRAVVRCYDGDHFQIYHEPLVSSLLQDQIAFLRGEFHVGG
jgi:uncharacterized protein